MRDKKKYSSNIRSLCLIISVLIATRVLFILLMPAVYSKDLHAWLGVIDLLKEGQNPYKITDVLNWPPFWMQILYVVHLISEFTSVSATHIIQTVLITGEVLVCLLTTIILTGFFTNHIPTVPLVFGLALNPVSIFLSCQHCNYDVFLGLWILLFTLALLGYHKTGSPVSWLMACFFIGMGILTKTVPFVLVPLLAIGIRKQNISTILFGLMLIFTPVVIGLSVIFVLAPAEVAANVLGYRSMAGWYGITGLMTLFDVGVLSRPYGRLAPLIILSSLAFFTWRCSKKQTITPRQLVTAALLIVLCLPTFGPGYSPPYISWFLPLAVIVYCISPSGRRRFLVVGYLVVMLTYCVEYAFFNSHGSFMTAFIPGERMVALSEQLSSRKSQVLIRLPMFLFYVSLTILLIRDLRKPVVAVPQELQHLA